MLEYQKYIRWKALRSGAPPQKKAAQPPPVQAQVSKDTAVPQTESPGHEDQFFKRMSEIYAIKGMSTANKRALVRSTAKRFNVDIGEFGATQDEASSNAQKQQEEKEKELNAHAEKLAKEYNNVKKQLKELTKRKQPATDDDDDDDNATDEPAQEQKKQKKAKVDTTTKKSGPPKKLTTLASVFK